MMLNCNLSRLFWLFGMKAYSTHYVTTPIFYVNAAPHIGHLYSAAIADTICRYQRLIHPEKPVHLCTGTDEHGTKVFQASIANKIDVMEYCNQVSTCYQNLFELASVDYTDFIRTTEIRHKNAVTHFWRTLRENNFIYKAYYKGWYCVADETFLTDLQLHLDESTGRRVSVESGHSVEWTEEENYMFRLSNIQADVIYWIKNCVRVRPSKFEKILLEMMRESLPDISISRPAQRVQWAISVPDDSSQTVYVWLDALVNYLTSAGYPDPNFKNLWPPKVHIIGKDILKFHGIYWPAFLIAAGLEPPQQIFVHSHWTVDGEKMSKSKNNVVDPMIASNTYSMEGLRYFLLREGVAHSDGNFSNVKITRILNAELADTLGNLLSRVCAKSINPRQVYPRVHTAQLHDILKTDVGHRLKDSIQELPVKCHQHYDDHNLHMVADTIMNTLHRANTFFELSRPWELKLNIAEEEMRNKVINFPMPQCNEKALRLDTIIAMTMDTLRLCGIALQPLLPRISKNLLDKLGVLNSERLWSNLNQNFIVVADGLNDPPFEVPLRNIDSILFKRLETKEPDAQQNILT